MDIKKQNEAMAEIDGLYVTGSVVWRVIPDQYGDPEQDAVCDVDELHHFYTDENVLKRIVRGMGEDKRRIYWSQLALAVLGYNSVLNQYGFGLASPTADQIREAIIRAENKWEEE